jgi:mRNA interferase RelE/StbE
MKMRTIRYSDPALKQLRAIGPVMAKRVMAKLDQFAADPSALANQVKRLQGMDALRLRVGAYRVIFTDDGMVLLVLKVGHRRDIYD